MITTLYTAKSGMHANQEKLDAISNNITNVGTTGYKRVEVGFKDLLTESLNRPSIPLNNESVMGTGVRTNGWIRDDLQGSLLETNIATDIALDGKGYMRVTLSDGSKAYTRDGSFKIDSAGNLVDSFGNNVDIDYVNGFNENNVDFTANNFLIDTSGNVHIKMNGSFEKVGEIPVYTALGTDSFCSIGENLYVLQEGVNPVRNTDVTYYQGYLEGSNVDIATEFADMIVTQRAFELSATGLKTADEMWGMINSIR